MGAAHKTKVKGRPLQGKREERDVAFVSVWQNGQARGSGAQMAARVAQGGTQHRTLHPRPGAGGAEGEVGDQAGGQERRPEDGAHTGQADRAVAQGQGAHVQVQGRASLHLPRPLSRLKKRTPYHTSTSPSLSLSFSVVVYSRALLIRATFNNEQRT